MLNYSTEYYAVVKQNEKHGIMWNSLQDISLNEKGKRQNTT